MIPGQILSKGMYWIYLIIFIVAVLIPDIVRKDILGIPQEQFEELTIFFLGMIGFLFFILKEHQLAIQKKEKEREQRRLQQTAKDLVESYSYIGEINRKMDILMQIGIGLSERPNLNKAKENEIYQSIIDSANFLLKADCSTLRFVNTKSGKTIKEVNSNEKCNTLKNSDLLTMGENIHIKHMHGSLAVCSHRTINNIKSYLIINSFDELQGKDNNNQEILKYLISQALFLYSYVAKAASQNK